MVSDYGLSPPNQFAQPASDYPPSQHPDSAFQQSYMSSDPPPERPELPNRQWTREVWGEQESVLPVRTESPTQFECPSNDNGCTVSQEPHQRRFTPLARFISDQNGKIRTRY
ncbi:unnamed protein product [Rhizoctonia solani]|uniref:Uncharacterized protein n=1 Tax=Rhizoctonia solani TaxID=456999 RepID=A0A8H3CKM8_9AGAM|nr:unnamed protein product [Rhizoctonia solani]